MSRIDLPGDCSPLELAERCSEVLFQLPEATEYDASERENKLLYDLNQISQVLGHTAIIYRIDALSGVVISDDEPGQNQEIDLLGENQFFAMLAYYDLLKIGNPGDDVYVRALSLGLRPAQILDGADFELYPKGIPSELIALIPTPEIKTMVRV